MNINLLADYRLEFLSLKGGCTGSSESIHVKMSHCWKSHVTAHIKTESAMQLSRDFPDSVHHTQLDLSKIIKINLI